MITTTPRYDREDPLVRLFHQASRQQWSAADVDWEAPLGMKPAAARALTRLVSPVYLGEHSAMYGAAGGRPQLAAAGEIAAQLHLSSFLMDEARHFAALTGPALPAGRGRRVPECLARTAPSGDPAARVRWRP